MAFEILKYIFDSDTSGLKKGLDDAKKGTDDLTKSMLSADGINKKVNAGFKDLAVNLGGALAGFLAVIAAACPPAPPAGDQLLLALRPSVWCTFRPSATPGSSRT